MEATIFKKSEETLLLDFIHAFAQTCSG